MLKGLIDPAKEVEKLNKKKTALQGTVDKLKKAMEVKDYESKVRYSSPLTPSSVSCHWTYDKKISTIS